MIVKNRKIEKYHSNILFLTYNEKLYVIWMNLYTHTFSILIYRQSFDIGKMNRSPAKSEMNVSIILSFGEIGWRNTFYGVKNL